MDDVTYIPFSQISQMSATYEETICITTIDGDLYFADVIIFTEKGIEFENLI